jgi:hypothetical protein
MQTEAPEVFGISKEREATRALCFGFDHARLTYRYSGRDFRLTDVHGEVVRSALA